MKKMIMSTVLVIILGLGLYYLFFAFGFYIPNPFKGELQVRASIKDGVIVYTDRDNNQQELVLRGINIDSSIPGYFNTDYKVDYDTWMRWFGQIQEMGVNTIRNYTVYDDSFYNAFYDYNKDNSKPLFLIQGIQVKDYANNNRNDAYANDFYNSLLNDSKVAVDVIHGRRNIPASSSTGTGIYRRDISDWVIGFIVGNEWNAATIEYTNNGKYSNDYSGKYFMTTEDASAFEALLASVMDKMLEYEVNKYNELRLITFANDPLSDPFEYDKYYGLQLGKFTQIDPEHIKTKSNYYGFYASYALTPFNNDFKEYFSEEQKEILKDILPELGDNDYVGGYAKLLSKYHTMPVIISSFECSTARGVADQDKRYNEAEQGEVLVEAYNHIMDVGCAGGFICAWQDSWNRKSWNTSYAIETYGNEDWQDVQTVAQHRGILAFESGKEAVCVVDGDAKEWTEVKELVSAEDNDGYSMKVNSDAKYLYLLVEGKNIRNELDIVFDTTPKSGSKNAAGVNPVFDRDVDFLLKINGAYNSKMYVQERYDSLRQNYLEKITGENPFEKYPEANTDVFVPIRMIIANKKIAQDGMSDEEIEKMSLYDTVETGVFRIGNANPESKYFDSLADFCYGTDLVEIRVPWALLNFSDPSQRKIHDDYYKNFGREDIEIDSIYVGVGSTKTSYIKLKEWQLQDWEKVEYRERLKQSYEFIKNSWEG